MILTILIIVSMACVGIFGFIMGMAVGYGSGYETSMMEHMTDEQKENYLLNKSIMNSIADKHKKFDL